MNKLKKLVECFLVFVKPQGHLALNKISPATNVLPLLLDQSHNGLKFHYIFTLGKGLKWDCLWNLGLVLSSHIVLGPCSQNGPILNPYLTTLGT
jgi:hypothetical protein